MNVILILADQLSAKWLGCYGNPAAVTPNLDAMAADGVRFDTCCVNQPVCMPSRASAITGRSPQHHGVYYNGWELGADLPTYPQVLQDAGVQTLGVGKFHLECHGRSARNDVTKYGFERAETTEDIRWGQWLDWVQAEYPQHFDRALATAWDREEPVADRRADYVAKSPAAHKKHPPDVRAAMTWPSVVPEEACQTRWVTDRALAFLGERDASRPFFLQMSFVDPHDPYDPPKRFVAGIDADAIPEPIRREDRDLEAVLRRFDETWWIRSLAAADCSVMRRYYLASLAFIDEEVGRLLAYLDATGLADDTVVIFTSDHGDMLGDHGLHTKGPWHFDACVRVPMLVRGPGIAPAAVRDVVTNLDLFPTITDLAGARHDVPLEGDSLAPLMRGGGGALDRPNAAMIETYGSYSEFGRSLQAWTVRTEEAALTLFGDQAGMLFDLANDPNETRNLFNRPEAGTLRREMTDLLIEMRMAQYDPLSGRGKHPTARH